MNYADPLSQVPMFPERRRGYDPDAVDQYLQAMQHQITELGNQLAGAEDRLRLAAIEVQPTESESATTLRAAKQAADDTISDAKRRAATALAEARQRAKAIVEEAQGRMEHARSVNEKIEQMKADTVRYVEESSKQIQAMRATADEEALATQEAAVATARATREQAEYDAADIRRRADADATSLRADTRDQIEQAKLAIKEAEQRLLTAAKQRGETITSEAKQRAETITSEAERLAGRTMTEARERAAQMHETAVAKADRITSEAERTAQERIDAAAEETKSMMATARTQILVETDRLRDQHQLEIDQMVELKHELDDALNAQRHAMDDQRQSLSAGIKQMQYVLDTTLIASDDATIDLEAAPAAPRPEHNELLDEMLDNAW